MFCVYILAFFNQHRVLGCTRVCMYVCEWREGAECVTNSPLSKESKLPQVHPPPHVCSDHRTIYSRAEG